MSAVVDPSTSKAKKVLTVERTEDICPAAEDEKQETSRNEGKVEKQPNKLKMTVQSQVYSATENNVFSETTAQPQAQILVSI